MADFLQNLSAEKQKQEAETRRQAEEARQQVRQQQTEEQAKLEAEARKEKKKIPTTAEEARALEKARRRRFLPFRRKGEVSEAKATLAEAERLKGKSAKELKISVAEARTDLEKQAQEALKSIDEQEAKNIQNITDWAKGEEDKFKAENIYIEGKSFYRSHKDWGSTGVLAVVGNERPAPGMSQEYDQKGVTYKTESGWVSKNWYNSLTPELQKELHKRGIDNFNAWLSNPNTPEPTLPKVIYESTGDITPGMMPTRADLGWAGTGQPSPVISPRTQSFLNEIATSALSTPQVGAIYGLIKSERAAEEAAKLEEGKRRAALVEFKKTHERHGGSWWAKDDWNNLSTDFKNIVNEYGYDGLKQELRKLYTELPDGNIIPSTSLAQMPPLMRKDVVTQGLKALEVFDKGKPIWQFKQMQDWGIIDKKAEFGGVDENGDFILKQEDLIDYITKDIEGSLKTPEARKEFYKGLQERGIGTKEFWKGVGIGMIPVAGTVYFWSTMKPYQKGLSVALDVATFIPFVNTWSAAVRAAAVPGVSMPKAITIGLGKALMAEVKAPFTAIRYPIKTAETVIYPVETVLRGRKIPLTAAEIRPHTVKIPYQELGSATTAKQARDILFDLQKEGQGTKLVIDGQEIQLTKTVLNTTGYPTAVHTTPDIRPFLEGIVIKEGREGGLFVSPTLHSRFTNVSAFGEAPTKGAMPGALIIRDEQILNKLKSSGKIYRGTVEIEKVLPAGINLPAPSQILITRDISGKELYLAVIGKKFTPLQIAKMKFVGSVDVIKDIFRPAYKIKGGATSKFDELIDFGNDYRKLEKELQVARKAGKTDEVTKIKNEMNALNRRAEELTRAIDREAAARSSLRALFLSRGDYIDTRTYRDLSRTNPVRLARYVRQLTPNNQRRVLNELEPSQRRKIETAIQRLRNEDIRRERAATRVRGTARVRATVTERATAAPREVTRVTPRVSRVEPPRRTTRVPRRVGTVLPPLPPPMPPVPPPPVKFPQSEEELTKEQREGAVTWRQGIFYIVIYPPYGEKNRFYTRIAPKEVREAKGPKSAYRSIARFIGPIRKDISFDMGIVDVKVMPNKKKDTPILEFKPDKEQMRKPHKKRRITVKKKPVLSRVK